MTEQQEQLEIRSLIDTPFEELVTCLRVSFIDYVVNFQEVPVEYWRKRWDCAGINYDISFGAFERSSNKLVAFVLLAEGLHEGAKTAFNCATGVIQQFRGQRLVNTIFQHAIPILRQQYQVTKLLLEVVSINERAVRAYKRVGFNIERTLPCYKYTGAAAAVAVVQGKDIVKTEGKDVDFGQLAHQLYAPTWEMRLSCLEKNRDNVECWSVVGSTSYVLVNKAYSNIVHYRFDTRDDGLALLGAVLASHPSFKCNHSDERDQLATSVFESVGMEKYLQQYEMEMTI
ncbi:hypothetical protein SAMD00019534_100850 [Acytostelium subglobosum LB1]|uniref:hypothetical protein n=1 Tax=Acytostelium subglobosum LB1 TaxID=1410327 RepID=UPI000644B089|nr:hypothetical protein SAMD00019534_100850 [Acytostelium subglobosum LB1]GAM26910.1 hypothetical protein SAMD00019534_100850 [Acytostelium subglobosum LB1]|eukprot:XP_012750178.1 hypothetical protein SAMD00019534_100850 [Acytostelium subglobosum LB1]